MDNQELRTREVFIENELKDAYLSYAMAVIIGRALPDVRDGLKPVHRRIIYAMKDLGNFSNKGHKKSARIVGEVIGKYHPHGDTAVYDAMVRLAQTWSLRYPLVDGQGNFGSIDGDNPAAMRYTEVKMTKLTERFLQDIDKKTVDFRLNFDDSLEEPTVLPTLVPNLLINGSSGIAVGMATNIPPHNLREVVEATIDVIDNPNQSVEELVRKNIVKAPDFPTAALGVLSGRVSDIYLKGEGAITMKAVCSIEEIRKNKEAIIIEEIPYQVNKTNLINQIVELAKSGKIKDISDIRDESNRNGIRVVIELKRDVDPNIILNQLYQYSSLKLNFNARMLAIVAGVPTILNLKQYLDNFISFRKEIIVKRTKFDLKKSEDRLHILEGLKIALENIDAIIKLIKGSKSSTEAKVSLKENYSLSELQAQSILEMKLQKLTGLEIEKLMKEYDEILLFIKKLQNILDKNSEQYKIIKHELKEIVDKYGDDRRTKLIVDEGSTNIEDLIQDEYFAVIITKNDYIKKVPLDAYKSQHRGGKGVKLNIKDEDIIKNLFVANSKDNVLIFTSDGNINWMKTYEVPTGTTQGRGRPIVNYIDLKGKKITNVINVTNLNEGYLMFLTKKGIIKKTEMKNFAKPRAGGIKAIGLSEGDTVLSVIYTKTAKEDIICESNVGLAIRFKQDDLSVLGRTAKGVKAQNLRGTEEVVGIELAIAGKTMFTISEGGFGKRTLLSEYPTIKRAGRGVIDIKTDDRNGKVVAMKAVSEDDELLLVTKKGKIIRTPVSDVRIIGRNTKGVKIVNLGDDDRVESVERIVNEEEIILTEEEIIVK